MTFRAKISAKIAERKVVCDGLYDWDAVIELHKLGKWVDNQPDDDATGFIATIERVEGGEGEELAAILTSIEGHCAILKALDGKEVVISESRAASAGLPFACHRCAAEAIFESDAEARSEGWHPDARGFWFCGGGPGAGPNCGPEEKRER